MSPDDIAAVGKRIGVALRAVVAKVEKSLVARLDALEAKIAGIPRGEKGEAGEKGERGDSVDISLVEQAIRREVAEQIVDLPVKQGDPGPKGEDADPAVMQSFVRDEVTRVVSALPLLKGDPGEKGERGDAAPPVDRDELRVMMFEEVSSIDFAALALKAAESIPRPKDGEQGPQGPQGEAGASVAMSDVQGMVDAALAPVTASIPELITEQVAAIPRPKDGGQGPQGPQGEPGTAGADVDMQRVQEFLRHEVATAVASLPLPKQGEQGEKGERGDSVLPEEVAAVVAETLPALVSEAVAALPAPAQGERGGPGPQGSQGIPGEPGAAADASAIYERLLADLRKDLQQAVREIPPPKDGESIHPDTVLRMVVEQVSRAVAEAPRPSNGRDAAELVVLPSIDQDRSYPQGTWARHRGGIMRAERTTEPLSTSAGRAESAGWSVMIDGVAGISTKQSDDFRKITVTTLTTSGVCEESQFAVPAMIYKGIWQKGEYSEYDCVSCNGSIWFANRATADSPLDRTDAWKLAVKHGRDGRDAGSLALSKKTNPQVRLK